MEKYVQVSDEAPGTVVPVPTEWPSLDAELRARAKKTAARQHELERLAAALSGEPVPGRMNRQQRRAAERRALKATGRR